MRNLDEFSITDEAVRRLAGTPDARLREIMISLVRHLHDFARDVRLTEAEWQEGIAFLTRTGHITDERRQEFILLSDTLGLSQLVVAQSHSRPAGLSEQTVFGPFHVEGAPEGAAHGTDIAQGIPGEPLHVSGRITGGGHPVADAVVDVWQADAEGFYDVQDADWTVADARLRATLRTDTDGRFSFSTILPKSYPIPTDGPVGQMLAATHQSPMRPAHIHFRVLKDGFDALITHVFIDGDAYLDSDAVFGVRGSCIGDVERHDPGMAPNGTWSDGPFHTLDCGFSLQPLC